MWAVNSSYRRLSMSAVDAAIEDIVSEVATAGKRSGISIRDLRSLNGAFSASYVV